MRFELAAAALVAGAAASYGGHPVESSSYPVSTPVYTPSSSEAYPVETPSSSEGYPKYTPSSSEGYPKYTPSSSEGYPKYTPSSSSKGYPVETPSYSAPPVYTTKVVPTYTTFCPGPTEITYGTKTYTVTSATTLTITDCPCTVSEPVYPTKTPVVPPVYSTIHSVPYPSSNGTKPTSKVPVGTGYPTASKPAPPEFTGAAAQAGAGLLAIAAGLAAFL